VSQERTRERVADAAPPGHDFSSARAPAGAQANESQAYTVDWDVAFGDGEFVPGTLQRQAANGADTSPAEVEAEQVSASLGGFIVDDGAPSVAPGQMRRGEFLDQVTSSACAAADLLMSFGGQSTEGCPYIDQALGRARAMTTAQIETAVRRFVDPEGVTAAADYIPRIAARVAEGVVRYLITGDTSMVPANLAAPAEAEPPAMQFKRDGGGDAAPVEVTRAASQLGRGAALDGGVRSRMEHAFGFDFSRVRIHTDARAASASSALSARAFTIGRHIAFSGSEYRPNTPAGDALLAHELAHVVQQGGGVHAKGGRADALDDDADRSAAGAVMRLWTGSKHVAASAMPRLRSGLQLQRCKSDPSEAEVLAKTVHDLLEATPLDEAAIVTALSAVNRDAAQATALRAAYKRAYKTDLEPRLKAKLSADNASRALFFLNAPLAEMGTETDVTVDAAGTEAHKAAVSGGEVVVRTDVDYSHGGSPRIGGFSVGYAGGGAAESRILQMLWVEVLSTQPDGSVVHAADTGLATSQNATMDLTSDRTAPTNPDVRKYKVDTASDTSPFYETAGMSIRTSTGTTIYDRPGEFVGVIHKEFDAGATKVVERDHFEAFVIQENKPVYEVSLVVEWIYTSKTAVTRTTTFGSGQAISALPDPVKKQLVKEFPKFEYIR
jgi:Domain of unknown function (DUF4157)